eukprot:3937028-Rhodomonas_salina.2
MPVLISRVLLLACSIAAYCACPVLTQSCATTRCIPAYALARLQPVLTLSCATSAPRFRVAPPPPISEAQLGEMQGELV